jgi:hypothetical protein
MKDTRTDRDPATERLAHEFLQDRSERKAIGVIIVLAIIAFGIARACGVM